MALRAASLSGDVQHIQLRVGVEGQGGCLIEALCSQQALGLELLLLRIVQAAVGNRGSVQEGGVDVVIAVLTDDLLRQIGEALHIPHGREEQTHPSCHQPAHPQ